MQEISNLGLWAAVPSSIILIKFDFFFSYFSCDFSLYNDHGFEKYLHHWSQLFIENNNLNEI